MKYIVGLILCFLGAIADAQVSLIVFSKDRPMQLYANLESTKKHMTSLDAIYVLYHAKNGQFQKGYDEVFSQFNDLFPALYQIAQNRDHPKTDFKGLLCNNIMPSITSDYILFSTDDIIITDDIDCNTCTECLEKTKSYGFYLRLGINITYNYMRDRNEVLPESLDYVAGDVYTWNFTKQGYWGYPNTVDMTIYRKKDIEQTLRALRFNSPNQLEGYWAGKKHRVRHERGVCFGHSRMVNIPANLVQTDFTGNRNENSYTPEELLGRFFAGGKIDIDRFYKIDNNSAHMPYEFTFINR